MRNGSLFWFHVERHHIHGVWLEFKSCDLGSHACSTPSCLTLPRHHMAAFHSRQFVLNFVGPVEPFQFIVLTFLLLSFSLCSPSDAETKTYPHLWCGCLFSSAQEATPPPSPIFFLNSMMDYGECSHNHFHTVSCGILVCLLARSSWTMAVLSLFIVVELILTLLMGPSGLQISRISLWWALHLTSIQQTPRSPSAGTKTGWTECTWFLSNVLNLSLNFHLFSTVSH